MNQLHPRHHKLRRSRAFLALGFVIAMGLLCSATPVAAQEQGGFTYVDQSIVKINSHRDAPADDESADETGTGIIIAQSPGMVQVLTARHVIHGASVVKVTLFRDKVHSLIAKILPASSDALDLAVLEVALPQTDPTLPAPTPFSLIHWLANDSIQLPFMVFTVNGDWEPTSNSIVRLDREGDIRRFEYTATSVGEGYSGAPIFNTHGQLIGIHLSQVPHSDYKLSVGVKIQTALQTLAALGYSSASLNNLSLGALASSHGTATAPLPASQTPQQWTNELNHKPVMIVMDGTHLSLTTLQGATIGEFVKGSDGKFIGTAHLGNCPGAGYMEVTSIKANRIDGRLQEIGGKGKCGTDGKKNMIPIAFTR